MATLNTSWPWQCDSYTCTTDKLHVLSILPTAKPIWKTIPMCWYRNKVWWFWRTKVECRLCFNCPSYWNVALATTHTFNYADLLKFNSYTFLNTREVWSVTRYVVSELYFSFGAHFLHALTDTSLLPCITYPFSDATQLEAKVWSYSSHYAAVCVYTSHKHAPHKLRSQVTQLCITSLCTVSVSY